MVRVYVGARHARHRHGCRRGDPGHRRDPRMQGRWGAARSRERYHTACGAPGRVPAPRDRELPPPTFGGSCPLRRMRSPCSLSPASPEVMAWACGHGRRSACVRSDRCCLEADRPRRGQGDGK